MATYKNQLYQCIFHSIQPLYSFKLFPTCNIISKSKAFRLLSNSFHTPSIKLASISTKCAPHQASSFSSPPLPPLSAPSPTGSTANLAVPPSTAATSRTSGISAPTAAALAPGNSSLRSTSPASPLAGATKVPARTWSPSISVARSAAATMAGARAMGCSVRILQRATAGMMAIVSLWGA